MQVSADMLAAVSFAWVLGIIGGVAGVIFLLVVAQFFGLYLQAYMSRASVGILELIGMRLRKVHLPTIVQSKIQLVKAGIVDITTTDLESHYLAGGRVPSVCGAMIRANRADIDLDWRKACAIDLAGRDILDAVNTSVNPKVIDCPSDRSDPSIRDSSRADKLDAVAKDGIRLLVKARVTVRTNLKQIIGGATEETVIARVGQAIVSAIGSADTYKDVLANPDHISKKALASGLDAGTAFEILSVDIADISVAGVDKEANVGAKLQAEQAEADKRRFQAEAEKRAALARAREAEMTALVQENRAKVVEAEAQVPLAMAEAFRNGNLGVLDYYRMKNIVADTNMRDAIGGSGKEEPHKPGGHA